MTRREFGLAFQADKSPNEYGRLAAKTEGYGVDVLSIYGDLLYQPPLPALIEAAHATSRIRLGPACLNPYTMHPYEIAGAIAALDRVSRGRAYLGLARGSWLDAIGIEPTDAVGRLAEASAVVRMLLCGDTSGFDGEVFRVEPGTMLRYEPPRDRVPLLIGGWGERTLALAGRISEEAKVGGSTNPQMASLARERIDSGTAAARRAEGSTGLVVGAVTVVDEDGAAARQLARREVAMYLDVVAGFDPTFDVPAEVTDAISHYLRVGDTPMAARSIPDEVLHRFAFAGTPEQVTQQAGALIDAGADRVEFGTPHGLDTDTGVDLLGERVIPALRA